MEQRYLNTYVVQEDGFINAVKLFEDLEKIVDEDKKNGVNVNRKHPVKKILNRFSGGYISPTAVKGFNNCPAGQLLGSLAPYDSTKFTSIGTTVHSILEEFYKQDGELRTFENLDLITSRISNENHTGQKEINIVKNHIEGFKNSPSYYGGPINHQNLNCFTELFLKQKCKPLGVEIPLTIYSAIDRVDITDQGINIIDYKTGTYFSPSVFTFDGYLPQMMVYSWIIKEVYGEDVNKAFIHTMATAQKYHDLEGIKSLKLQSMYIDTLFKYQEESLKCHETRIFKQSVMPYCNSCPISKNCPVKNKTKVLPGTKINIKYDITLPQLEEEEQNDKHQTFEKCIEK